MVIFGKIAKLSTDGTPQFLFYMSGNLIWGYFSTCLSAGKSIFQSNAGLFSRVYFPRLCVPISQNISALFRLFIQILIFICFYLYFAFKGENNLGVTWNIILLPLLILQCSVLGLGTGMFISSFTTKYKDLNFMYNYLIRFWYFISPVVYPLSVIPEDMRYIASFNPMVAVIETSRFIIFGNSSIQPVYILNSLVTTSILFFLGLLIFNQVEKTFIDTV
tara:strand:- start:55 stop:711 length:657 start_codon:yes stop_codon:yes gene_type:complete